MAFGHMAYGHAISSWHMDMFFKLHTMLAFRKTQKSIFDSERKTPLH